jgi:hypothetical protein
MPLLTVRLDDSEYSELQRRARAQCRPTRDQLRFEVVKALADVDTGEVAIDGLLATAGAAGRAPLARTAESRPLEATN